MADFKEWLRRLRAHPQHFRAHDVAVMLELRDAEIGRLRETLRDLTPNRKEPVVGQTFDRLDKPRPFIKGISIETGLADG